MTEEEKAQLEAEQAKAEANAEAEADENGDEDKVDYKALSEESMKRIEATDAKNRELLNELKRIKERNKQAELEAEQAHLKKAEDDGDYKTQLAITRRQLEERDERDKQKEIADQNRAQDLLVEAQKEKFRKEMGDVSFHDFEDAFKKLDSSKFLRKDNATGWDEEGVRQAISDFKEKRHYLYVSNVPDTEVAGANGSKKKEGSESDDYYASLLDQ